jgi:hypothetical protein
VRVLGTPDAFVHSVMQPCLPAQFCLLLGSNGKCVTWGPHE